MLGTGLTVGYKEDKDVDICESLHAICDRCMRDRSSREVGVPATLSLENSAGLSVRCKSTLQVLGSNLGSCSWWCSVSAGLPAPISLLQLEFSKA